MLDEREFERALAWYAEQVGEARLLLVRKRFEDANGAIVAAEADFEQRMAHFWEGVMCSSEGEGDAPIARYAAAQADAARVIPECAAWLRSHRSLFDVRVTAPDGIVLRDLRLGSELHCVPGPRDHELRVGDRFDARLVVSDGRLWISAGRVFYPSGTHAALDALLARIVPGSVSQRQLLDALLRMRASYLRFESMKPEHVFRIEALHAAPDSAAWAIKAPR
jgi:hypothetical protein